MKIEIDIKVVCTCGRQLYIVMERTGEITVMPCPDCRKEKADAKPYPVAV